MISGLQSRSKRNENIESFDEQKNPTENLVSNASSNQDGAQNTYNEEETRNEDGSSPIRLKNPEEALISKQIIQEHIELKQEKLLTRSAYKPFGNQNARELIRQFVDPHSENFIPTCKSTK